MALSRCVPQRDPRSALQRRSGKREGRSVLDRGRPRHRRSRSKTRSMHALDGLVGRLRYQRPGYDGTSLALRSGTCAGREPSTRCTCVGRHRQRTPTLGSAPDERAGKTRYRTRGWWEECGTRAAPATRRPADPRGGVTLAGVAWIVELYAPSTPVVHLVFRFPSFPFPLMEARDERSGRVNVGLSGDRAGLVRGARGTLTGAARYRSGNRAGRTGERAGPKWGRWGTQIPRFVFTTVKNSIAFPARGGKVTPWRGGSASTSVHARPTRGASPRWSIPSATPGRRCRAAAVRPGRARRPALRRE